MYTREDLKKSLAEVKEKLLRLQKKYFWKLKKH